MVPIRLFHLKTRAFIAIGVALALVLGSLTAITMVLSIWTAAPMVEDYDVQETTVIYDADGEPLAGLYEEDRRWVELDEIPREFQQAFVAVEDRNFRHHRGVDLRAIVRAMVRNIRNLSIVEGGSTITQQLARNVYLDHARTFTRKLQEMRIALELERRYSKDEILEMYLNEIYLGAGAYGVHAAAQRYFDKDVDELELDEIAMLAALPRSPEYYSPYRDPELAQNRRDLVLQIMSGMGYITQSEADEAAGEEVQVADDPLEAEDLGHYFVKHVRNQLIARFGAHRVYTGGLRVHTTLDRRKQEAAEEVIEQAFADGVLPTREVITDEARSRDIPNGAADEQQAIEVADLQPQPALATLDTSTGAVRALVGGRGEDSFNRATQSTRQPGSAFKPFIYAAALREGHYPGTVVNDLPIVFQHPDPDYQGQVWPINYDHRYRGLISYRDALAYSVNVAAVRTLASLGVEEVREHIDAYGFSTLTEQDGVADHYSFALGGLQRGVSPLEMAAAYGVFHDGRSSPSAYTITKVETADGVVLFEREPPEPSPEEAEPEISPRYAGQTDGADDHAVEVAEIPGAPSSAVEEGEVVDLGDSSDGRVATLEVDDDTERVLSDAEAYLMRDMLRSVVERGTGRHAAQDIPVGGKTGTTDRNSDGWFVGFADELVTAVWLGEDTPAPMEYTFDDDGRAHHAAGQDPEATITGVHASRIWGAYMQTILAEEQENEEDDNDDADDEPNRWEARERPDEIVELEIDPITGLAPADNAPRTTEEIATRRSAPRMVSGFWGEFDSAEVDLRSGYLAGPTCVFPYTESWNYVVEGGYRLGPARIHLGNNDAIVTSAGDTFRGVYEVGQFEPVQEINTELGVPTDPMSVNIQRVPDRPCPLPVPEDEDTDERLRIDLLE